eukprot:CAMPEP_0194528768 /NCGR_PEP_ID=MMETSP0253-20130528/65244_1 /TAXON_ID=2966 /ORGANISM="Noctiluca scintillans" /LENGTH=65 /DNA_ID=CAMNT_0039373847 /DNA_START=79 /DNA_END=272 /DNA_ORIENTATION=+
MPTLSVALVSGELVLPGTFLLDDSSLKQLVHAAAQKVGVAPTRCFLLSPRGERMEHFTTPSQEAL